MIREKLIFTLPQPQGQLIPRDYDQIFGANYFEDWDFNDTSTMTFSGSDISGITSKGLNGGLMSGVGSNPLYVASVVNGKGVGRFDGVSDALRNSAGKSFYNFLHDGSGGAIIFIAKTRLANPNAAYRLASSWANTTQQGISVRYDDRSSVARVDRLLSAATRSSSGTYSAFNFSGDNAFPPNQWNSLVSIFDTDNATAADRSEMYVNDGTVINNNTSTLSAAAGNATQYLNLGRTATTSSFQFDGDFARVLIVDTIPNSTQLMQLAARINYDYGI